ncbi:MAG: DMT family transporter [Acidobacteria bacterium]|nr:DMT family transporter [Acidobacteriota bacterium]
MPDSGNNHFSLPADALLYAFLCFCWGTTWLAIKISLVAIPPILGVALRFSLAASIMVAVAVWRRQKFPHTLADHGRLMLVGGMTFSLGYILVYFGEQYISSGLTSVLFATFPLFVSLFAHFLIPGERINRYKIGGVLIGICGVVVLFYRDIQRPDQSTLGIALVVTSALIAALSNVYSKRVLQRMSLIAFNTLALVYGCALTWMFWLLMGGNFQPGPALTGSLLATAYLSVFGTVLPFLGLFWLLTRMDTTRLSMITLITPVLALILGWLIMDERISVTIFVAATLILAGVVLVLRGSRRAYVRS